MERLLAAKLRSENGKLFPPGLLLPERARSM